MKPYYDDGHAVIYHGECLDVLPNLRADVVITDPPFGISDSPNTYTDVADKRSGNRTGGVNTWHPPSDWDHALDPLWGPACASAAAIVAWFGHWRHRGEVEASMPIPLRCEIVWAKDTHVGPPCPAAMRDERIWVFSAAGLKPTRFETTVWDSPIIPTWAHRHHKNEKPESLMARLVSWLPGDTVLDPFMGSGTTLVAAKRLGKRSVGIEREERYCEIAAKRLSQGALPLEFGT